MDTVTMVEHHAVEILCQHAVVTQDMLEADMQLF